MMYDLAIIGGGPAGVAAGVYAARKRLKTIFIAETVGGQSVESTEIQNWIGTEKISGTELAKSLERHLRAYAEDVVDIKLGKRVTRLDKDAEGFTLVAGEGTYQARAVLIASGGRRLKLAVPGGLDFENKGLTYCASCDGALFAGQDVVVVGGGNAGFESAAQLLAYCKSVTLIHRGADFTKADASTVEAVSKHPNMHLLKNSEPIEVKGETFVSGIVVKDLTSGETTTLPVTGVFVEIGTIPNTDYMDGLVELSGDKHVPVNHANQRVTSGGVEVSGLWAAGDVTTGRFHQNNIAAGDAVKALEDIYYYVKAH